MTKLNRRTKAKNRTNSTRYIRRSLFSNTSLADLYDETLMPAKLRNAHQANDKAVLAAYGFPVKISESDSPVRRMASVLNNFNYENDSLESYCVAELFKMYEKLVEGK